jgi:hypothetical protein
MDVSVNTTTGQIVMQGTISDLNTLFTSGRLSISYPLDSTARPSIDFAANDLSNGDPTRRSPATAALKPIPVTVSCLSVAAPTIVSAIISNSLNSMLVTFSRSFQSTTNCLNYLSEVTLALLGTSPNCIVISSTQFKYTFDNLQTINLAAGSVAIAVRASTISVCPGNTNFATGSVNLQAPVNPDAISVRLDGYVEISPCNSISVSAFLTIPTSSFMTFSWTITGSDSSSVDASTVSTSMLVKEPVFLTPGVTYTVAVTVSTNQFGTAISGSKSIDVAVKALPFTQVKIAGGTAIMLRRSKQQYPYTVRSILEVPTCLPAASAATAFQWSMSPDLTAATGYALPSITTGRDYTFNVRNIPVDSTPYTISIDAHSGQWRKE